MMQLGSTLRRLSHILLQMDPWLLATYKLRTQQTTNNVQQLKWKQVYKNKERNKTLNTDSTKYHTYV